MLCFKKHGQGTAHAYQYQNEDCGPFIPYGRVRRCHAIALFTDLVINGGIIDMWKGAYSFVDLLVRRKMLYLQFAGLGAILGFIYWLFFFRKYRHYDPLDKYFK